jgi:2-dehydropantoate 2-reductase
MLQDLELSRPLEIDAILGSVQELGQITKTQTPIIDTILAVIKLRAKTAGLYMS